MPRKKSKPLGAEPWHLWFARQDAHPSLIALLVRYRDVLDAVRRYKEAGLTPPHLWLVELGTDVPVLAEIGGMNPVIQFLLVAFLLAFIAVCVVILQREDKE